jgi:hypothetical protein
VAIEPGLYDSDSEDDKLSACTFPKRHGFVSCASNEECRPAAAMFVFPEEQMFDEFSKLHVHFADFSTWPQTTYIRLVAVSRMITGNRSALGKLGLWPLS